MQDHLKTYIQNLNPEHLGTAFFTKCREAVYNLFDEKDILLNAGCGDDYYPEFKNMAYIDVKSSLKLDYCGFIEDYKPNFLFDGILAFGSLNIGGLNEQIANFEHLFSLLKPNGIFLLRANTSYFEKDGIERAVWNKSFLEKYGSVEEIPLFHSIKKDGAKSLFVIRK